MKTKKVLILTSLMLAGLAGCSSEPRVVLSTSEAERIAVADNTQALLDITPAWYMTPPLSSQGHIYSVSTAVNEDLQFAINKAVLMAEQKIVKKMATEVSSIETSEVTNSGGSNDSISSEYMEARINKAGLFGHVISKREVFPDPSTGEFRAFIMVYLSSKSKADILSAAIKGDDQLSENVRLKQLIVELENVELNKAKQDNPA